MRAICGKKSIHLIYHANLAQQKKQLKISNHHLEFLNQCGLNRTIEMDKLTP